MRITNRNQMHSFMNRMNSNLNKLTSSNDKMASQRSFNKSWENVADATRSLKVRRLLRANEHSLTNIRDVQGRMNVAEDNLNAINDILENTLDRDLQGLNGTYDVKDREKIATEIDNLQRQVLSLMNGKYADEYLFGAAGGATSEAPFKGQVVTTVPDMKFDFLWDTDPAGDVIYDTDALGNKVPRLTTTKGWMSKTEPVLDAGGLITDYKPVTKKVTDGLTYNGMLTQEMKQDPVTGKIIRQKLDPNYATNVLQNPSASPYELDMAGEIVWEEIPFNKNNYIDIGLGFKLKGQSAAPETAMQYTFSGAELFGVGVDEDGQNNNVYELLGDISESLRTNNMDTLGLQLGKVKDARDRLMVGITQIGTSSKFCEEMGRIIENDSFVLKTTQTDLESVDLSEEVINNKDHEMAWMVTLQLGSKVLPTSLFDFMR